MNKIEVLKVGGYRHSDFPAEDLALWIKLTELGDFCSVPSVLLQYRINPKSISALNRKLQLNKMQEALLSYSNLLEIYIESISNFEETVRHYQSTEMSSCRIFLHLRDIHLAEKLLSKPSTVTRLFKTLEINLGIKVLLAGVLLAIESVLRKLYRFTKITVF